jgi:hypothetical protein
MQQCNLSKLCRRKGASSAQTINSLVRVPQAQEPGATQIIQPRAARSAYRDAGRAEQRARKSSYTGALQNKVLQILDIVTSLRPCQNSLPVGRSGVRPRAQTTEAAVALHTPLLPSLVDLQVRTASVELRVVAQARK